jgi:hypothetical protein
MPAVGRVIRELIYRSIYRVYGNKKAFYIVKGFFVVPPVSFLSAH